MAKYTLELDDLLRDETFELFDFMYEFYTDDAEVKRNFERKFIDHYLFHEIGFETVYRFKRMLQAHLRLKMPYYTQLYEIEVAKLDLDFINNKNYTETRTRELNRTGLETVGADSKSDTTETTDASESETGTNNKTANTKVSNIEDGVASVGLAQGSLTGVSEQKDDIDTTLNKTQEGASTSTTIASSDSERQTDGQEIETETMTGIGNIGVVPAGHMIESWRSILINLDEIIIEDCGHLFMKIY